MRGSRFFKAMQLLLCHAKHVLLHINRAGVATCSRSQARPRLGHCRQARLPAPSSVRADRIAIEVYARKDATLTLNILQEGSISSVLISINSAHRIDSYRAYIEVSKKRPACKCLLVHIKSRCTACNLNSQVSRFNTSFDNRIYMWFEKECHFQALYNFSINRRTQWVYCKFR